MIFLYFVLKKGICANIKLKGHFDEKEKLLININFSPSFLPMKIMKAHMLRRCTSHCIAKTTCTGRM